MFTTSLSKEAPLFLELTMAKIISLDQSHV
jgi:hypothetical protein